MFYIILAMAIIIVIMGVIKFFDSRKIKSLVKAKNDAEYQTKKTIQNLDTLVDHTIVDDNIKHRQQVFKNKVLGANNEKDYDQVVNHVRNIFNNNSL